MLARVSARLLQGLTDLACTVCRDERVSDGTPHWCHESNGLPVWCYKSCADSHATQAHPERLTFPVAGWSVQEAAHPDAASNILEACADAFDAVARMTGQYTVQPAPTATLLTCAAVRCQRSNP